MTDLEALRMQKYEYPSDREQREQPPCRNCGHTFGHHDIPTNACIVGGLLGGCPCPGYEERDAQDDADDAYDAATARWEEREGR